MRAGPRLFLDASVWIAAAGSPTGASSLVLALCRHRRASATSSQLVLSEAERNLARKLGRNALLRFYQEIATLDLEVVDPPILEEIATQARIIDAKDAHVLAAALKGQVDVLLTLDRRHFFAPSVLEARLRFQILTPGDFLRDLIR